MVLSNLASIRFLHAIQDGDRYSIEFTNYDGTRMSLIIMNSSTGVKLRLFDQAASRNVWTLS